MSRSLTSIVILLAPLALLGACIEVAPRSSVAFQAPAEREIRYAAEVALAIKEDRRDATSEAAVNGRLVLPQMPEIWAISPSRAPVTGESEQELALLASNGPAADAATGVDPPPAGCEGRRLDPGDPEACPSRTPDTGPALPALFPATIAPGAAPPAASDGPSARYRLHFALGSADLDAAARRVLDGVIGSALLLQPSRIIVAGHAEGAGGAGPDPRLSARRAATVVDALIRAGIPADRIETRTLGRSLPAVHPPDQAGDLEITLA